MSDEIYDGEDALPDAVDYEEEAVEDVSEMEELDDDIELGDESDIVELDVPKTDKEKIAKLLEIRRAIEARNEQKLLDKDLNYLELDMDLDDDEDF